MYEGDPANFTFNGSVSIEITCVRPTNRITLHMKKLKITSKHQLVLHEIALPFYLPFIKKVNAIPYSTGLCKLSHQNVYCSHPR